MQLQQFLEELFEAAVKKASDVFAPPEQRALLSMRQQFNSRHLPAERHELYQNLHTKNHARYTPQQLVENAYQNLAGWGISLQNFDLGPGELNAKSAIVNLSAILTKLLIDAVLRNQFYGDFYDDIARIETVLGLYESRNSVGISQDEEQKFRNNLARSLIDSRPVLRFLTEHRWAAKNELSATGGQYL